MSFLFGKKNRQANHNTALPPATREAPSSAVNSSIPTANGPSKLSPNEKRSAAGAAKSPPPGPPLGSSFGSSVNKEVGVNPDGVDSRGQDGTGGGHEKDIQPVFPTQSRDELYRICLLLTEIVIGNYALTCPPHSLLLPRLASVIATTDLLLQTLVALSTLGLSED